MPGPVSLTGRLGLNPDRTRKVKRFVRRKVYRIAADSARARHLALIADRYARLLLEPFTCAGCGERALDPIGRNGKREFLCQGCADSTEREERPS
jgi:hypothetical protein